MIAGSSGRFSAVSARDHESTREGLAQVPGIAYVHGGHSQTGIPAQGSGTRAEGCGRLVVGYVGVGGVGAGEAAEQAAGLIGAEPGEPAFGLDQGDVWFGGGGDAADR